MLQEEEKLKYRHCPNTEVSLRPKVCVTQTSYRGRVITNTHMITATGYIVFAHVTAAQAHWPHRLTSCKQEITTGSLRTDTQNHCTLNLERKITGAGNYVHSMSNTVISLWGKGSERHLALPTHSFTKSNCPRKQPVAL